MLTSFLAVALSIAVLMNSIANYRTNKLIRMILDSQKIYGSAEAYSDRNHQNGPIILRREFHDQQD
ncbi:hypothetical protein QU585_09920 [Lactiplantibacillus plantarum]|uniref:hypothetical protein n=1 Tax=Lactiplantibacillus plantarum TaxID=1590 RepID=UPI002741424E|nr:hypothetical protein [Lactiplantibacillus plantarum]MDP5372475.1 hypothetical protein [Lactiplantibacillus plantarum]